MTPTLMTIVILFSNGDYVNSVITTTSQTVRYQSFEQCVGVKEQLLDVLPQSLGSKLKVLSIECTPEVG